MSRFKARYLESAMPALTKEFGYKSSMAVPKIEKIVVNMGLGGATQNAKIIDTGADELGRITGQRPSDDASQEVGCCVQGCARGCRSARWSPCAASGCTSFSTA